MEFLKFSLHLAETCTMYFVAVLLIPTFVLTSGALGIFGLLLPDSWLDQKTQDKNRRYHKKFSAGLLGGGESATVGDSSLVNGHAGLEEVSAIGSGTQGRCSWCGSLVKVGHGCDCGSVLPPAVSSATVKGMPSFQSPCTTSLEPLLLSSVRCTRHTSTSGGSWHCCSKELSSYLWLASSCEMLHVHLWKVSSGKSRLKEIVRPRQIWKLGFLLERVERHWINYSFVYCHHWGLKQSTESLIQGRSIRCSETPGEKFVNFFKFGTKRKNEANIQGIRSSSDKGELMAAASVASAG